MADYLALLSFSEGGWGTVIFLGAGVTIALALCCLPLGLPLGLLSAILIQSNNRFLRLVATVFSSIFRGLPELLTLFLVYYGLQALIMKALLYFQLPAVFEVNAFFAGVLALSMVFAAFSSEVWLGAFRVIDRGQYEAAKALNLSRKTTFLKVILPQLIRHALPGLSNNWLTLLKDTSLVSIISLIEIMYQAQLAQKATKQTIFFYSVACVFYLLFSAISGLVFRWLEARYDVCYRKASTL